MKSTTVILVAALAALVWAPSVLGSRGWPSFPWTRKDVPGPDFCRGIECPPFHAKNASGGYEIRTYDAGKWVTSTTHAARVELAIAAGFARIGLYLGGRNSDSLRIKQTVPVSAYFHKKDTFEEGRNYTIALYIPGDLQTETPVPTDDSVVLVDVPETTVYAASFPGYATEGLVLKQAELLRNKLVKDGVDFVDGSWVFSVYDPPTKFTGRHNEVAFLAKSDAALKQGTFPLQRA